MRGSKWESDTRGSEPAFDSRKRFTTALGLHMLAAHGFCGGRGSRFRFDPATAAGRIALVP